MTASIPTLVIAGGGLAGCLAALAIAERRPDVPLLVLEAEDRFGGDHVWSSSTATWLKRITGWWSR
jgi:lycopene beta-cyclase